VLLDVYNSLGAATRPAEQIQAVRTIPVVVTTLDAVADRAAVSTIDLLKIDVEGAEQRVLEGAEHIIRRSPGLQILMEIYEPSAVQCGCSSERQVEMLRSWGFTAYRIGPTGLAERCNSDEIPGTYALFRRH